MATLVEKTIGPGDGYDYASIGALADDAQDLVVSGQYWEVTCAAFADGSQCTWDGWNTSEECYLKIKGSVKTKPFVNETDKYYFIGNANAPRSMVCTTVGASGLIIFENLQFFIARAAAVITWSGTSASKWVFRNCFIEHADINNLANIGVSLNDANSTATITFEGCVIKSIRDNVYTVIANAPLSTWKNCTICPYFAAGTRYGMNNYSKANTLINCYIGASYMSINNTSNINMTKVATFDDKGSEEALQNVVLTTDNFNNVTWGDDLDLTPKAGTALDAAGTDISGEDYTTDILGNAYVTATPTIGAVEINASSAGDGGGDKGFAAIYILG
jgi:hypothetical protein